MITHVAVKYNDKLYYMPKPFHHAHVIRMIGGVKGLSIQGFFTDKWHFLSRKQALVHAKFYGQLKSRLPGQYDGDELFSEDLW